MGTIRIEKGAEKEEGSVEVIKTEEDIKQKGNLERKQEEDGKDDEGKGEVEREWIKSKRRLA